MATFPSYPRLLFDPFSPERDSALNRTDMETGPPKQLKTKSRVMVTRSVVYWLTTLADYESFIAWFQTDINYGADWFDWTDPVDGAVKSARIVSKLESERPMSALKMWKVGFRLETWSA